MSHSITGPTHLLFIYTLLGTVPAAHGQELLDHWYQPSGPVNAIVVDTANGLVHIGGAFTSIGRTAPYGAAVEGSEGELLPSTDRPNHHVNKVVADGEGGWYILGHFTRIGSHARTYVARLNADGSLHPWQAQFDVMPHDLHVYNGQLHVVGSFTWVNDQPREGWAAFNVESGQLLPYGGPDHIALTHPHPHTIAISGDTAYIAGNELNLISGPVSQTLIELESGDAVATWAMPNIPPSTYIGDGNGGWILGGAFTGVVGETRNGLAWYDPNGTLRPWAPNVEGEVNALLLEGGTLYVGGEFTSIDGQPRRNIAAFDWGTGLLLPLGAPDLDTPEGPVERIRMADGKLFLAGGFGGFGTTVRNASLIDPSTGSLVAGFGGTDKAIRAAIPDGEGGWYIGGDFSEVAGVARKRLARINADGSLHEWAPDLKGDVYCLALDGNSLFVGGELTEVDATSRMGMAEFNIGTGALTSWNPTANGRITNIAVADSLVFVSGDFTSVGHGPMNKVARISRNTGSPLPIIGFSGAVNTMTSHGDKLYMGGDFSERIKVINIHTGWTMGVHFPSINGAVRSMVVQGDTLYITGAFNWIGGQTRQGVAAFDVASSTANLLPWMPTATIPSPGAIQVNGADVIVRNNAGVRTVDRTDGTLGWSVLTVLGQAGPNALAISQNMLFLGGDFTCLPCQPQGKIAAIDPVSGMLLDWRPTIDFFVSDLVVHDGQVLIGGDFTTVNGQPRKRVAALSVESGELLPFSPNVHGWVRGLAVDGNDLFIHGDFTGVGSYARNRVAKLDLATGGLAGWNPSITGTVRSLIIHGDRILLAGGYSATDGSGRLGLAAVDRVTAEFLPWSPGRSGQVSGMALQNDELFVHGLLGTEAHRRTGIAAVRIGTGEVLPFNANANNYVTRLLVDGDRLFAAGPFTQIAGQSLPRLAVMDRFSGSAGNWTPQPNGAVNTMVLHDGELYIGGEFTQIGNAARNRLAVYTVASNHLQPWSPDVNGVVNDLHVANGLLYMGGNFTTVNGADRRYAGAFELDTRLLHSWEPNMDERVNSIGSSGSTIYLGGHFRIMNAIARRGHASLLLETGVPGPFEIQLPSGYVTRMALHGSKLYISGSFNNVNGHARNGLAAVDIPSGEVTPFQATCVDVEAMLPGQDTLFIGGRFSHVNGQARSRLAALDAGTGELLPWAPSVGSHVFALARKGAQLYVGGNFTTLGGQPVAYLGSFDLPDGTLTGWRPQPDRSVHTLAVAGDHIIAGGKFNGIGYAMRRGIAMLDMGTGHATGWDAHLGGTAYSSLFPYANTVLPSDTGVFVLGEFNAANDQPRSRLALLDPVTAMPSDWNPGLKRLLPPTEVVNCLAYHDGILFVGGAFSETVDRTRHYFAPITVCDATFYYSDVDGDGLGDPATAHYRCSPGLTGYVTNASDCDDTHHGQGIGSPCDDGNPATVDDTWTAECTCEGQLPTAISSHAASNGFRAFPNPARDVLHFSELVTGGIHDVQGRLLIVLARAQYVSLSGLASGVYQVRTTEGAVLRFVKE